MEWFDDFFDELDWLDIGLIGGFVEESLNDEKEIKKIKKEFDDDGLDQDEDYT